jgi:hypothetical protein
MKKARELMLKHHIEETRCSSCHFPSEEEPVIEKINVTRGWETEIFSILAQNMRCDMFRQTQSIGNRHIVILIGFSSDIEAIKIMGNFLNDVCARGLRLHRKNLREKGAEETLGVASAYRLGFRRGVNTAFKEQNENQEYHLMVVIPEKVKDATKEFCAGKKITHPKCPKVNIALYSTYQRGYADGKKNGGKRQLNK